jgi:hypothetical protein
MDHIFYTLQDFLTHTKGVTYIIMALALCAIGGYWAFLAGGDEDH